MRSLYIHTPFCVHKCHYCDFYSFVDQRDQQPAFIERLERELTALAPHAGPLETIFIGGGTPSLLRLELWERLLRVLHDRFDLSAFSPDAPHPGEFTVECNPESATLTLCHLLAARGVNRVSVGAQSFDPRHLKTLERWHDPENVARALDCALAAGIVRRSIDLIFAIPGQTLEHWNTDLERALALGLSHVSCYNLTYEPNTAMTRRLAQGEFTAVNEDLEAEMSMLTQARLAAAGLARYEVSNFAAPGQESRHNLAYWRQDQWLAAGPSASAHVFAESAGWRVGSWRYKNTPRLGDYLSHDGRGTGFAPITNVEPPEPTRLVRERIMMGLRLSEGLDSATLLSDVDACAPRSRQALESAAARAEASGWLRRAHDRWTLTDDGFLMADSVASDLMSAVE